MGLFTNTKKEKISFPQAAAVFGELATNFMQDTNISALCPNMDKDWTEGAFIGATLCVNLYNNYKKLRAICNEDQFIDFAKTAIEYIAEKRNIVGPNGAVVFDPFIGTAEILMKQENTIEYYAQAVIVFILVKAHQTIMDRMDLVEQVKKNLVNSVKLTKDFFDKYEIEL